MKKILIAVDDTRGSMAVVSTFHGLVRKPEKIILLHVKRLQGRSMMIDMLGDAEMSTLRESMKGTEYKYRLDRRAETILTHYEKELKGDSQIPVKTLLREGHPGEEILKVARDEEVDLIIIGSNGKKGLHRLITGCISKYVERRAKTPIIIAKEREGEEAYSYKRAWEVVYAAR